MDQATDARPGEAGLAGRAMHGAVVLSAAQAVKLATSMVSTVVLARLLSPHDFGVFAMVMPLVGIVMLFQDLGLAQAVETAASLDHAQETTLFAINLALAIALAAAVAAAAPALAAFYGAREVIGPTLALAGSIVLSGLATLQFALLVRSLAFSALAVADIAGALAGIAAAIGVALAWPGPWALVASVGANMTAGLVCAWWATGWRPGRPAPLARVRSLLGFGRGMIGANLAGFVTRNADNVLIARWLGPVPLGLYDRGYKLLLLPVQQVVGPLGRIVIPILARLVDTPARYRQAYVRTLDPILLVALPGMTVAVAMADVLVPFVMGERWRPVVPIFRWLGLVGLHLPLSATLPWLLTSQARTRELARLATFQAVTSVAGFVAGLPFGVVGVAAIYAITDVGFRLPMMIWYVGRRGPVTSRAVVNVAAPHAGGVGLAALALWWLRGVAVLPPFAMLAAATLLAYAAAWMTVALVPARRGAFAALLALARQGPA